MYISRKFAPDLGLVRCSIPEDDAPAWAAGTSYPLNARVVRDHRIYQSAIPDNRGLDPLAEDQSVVAARWVFDRYTNAFACFDGVLNNATVASEDPGAEVPWLDPAFGIDPASTPVILDLPGLSGIDTLILFGVSASRVRLICLDLNEKVLLDRESGLSGRQVGNWWGWFFDAFSAYSDKFIALDIPGPTRRIVLALQGAQVRLGEIFLGASFAIGAAQVGSTEGRSISGSRYSFNDYGSLTLAKGPTRVEMDYRVVASKALWDQVKPELDRNSGSLVAAIGSTTRASSVQFGILGPVKWGEDLPDEYEYSFTITGVA
jgi:hypothetical protein